MKRSTVSRSHAFTGHAALLASRGISYMSIALMLGLASVGGALARPNIEELSPQVASQSAFRPAGMTFGGPTGTVGMGADHSDRLIFANRSFHSQECIKWGFERTVFHAERDGRAVRFTAVSVSRQYGTLAWEGVIRDGNLEARYVWTNERLFWTIRREYWFKGELIHAGNK